MGPSANVDHHEIKRLIDLMKDPRYWRDHDPRVEQDVRVGFRRLCGKPESGIGGGGAAGHPGS